MSLMSSLGTESETLQTPLRGAAAMGRFAPLRWTLLASVLVLAGSWIPASTVLASEDAPAISTDATSTDATEPMHALRVEYLEIVTPDVDAVCATYERTHGVRFGEPVPELGNARTAELAGGGRVGVRAPLRESEEPVVRPYWLVEDLAAAVKAAEANGALIALPSMEIPGQGTIAIYLQAGIEHALWQR